MTRSNPFSFLANVFGSCYSGPLESHPSPSARRPIHRRHKRQQLLQRRRERRAKPLQCPSHRPHQRGSHTSAVWKGSCKSTSRLGGACDAAAWACDDACQGMIQCTIGDDWHGKSSRARGRGMREIRRGHQQERRRRATTILSPTSCQLQVCANMLGLVMLRDCCDYVIMGDDSLIQRSPTRRRRRRRRCCCHSR